MSQTLPEGWTPPKWLAQFSKIELAYLAEKRHETAIREHAEMRAWMARALTAEQRLTDTPTASASGPAQALTEAQRPAGATDAPEVVTGPFSASASPHGRRSGKMDLMDGNNPEVAP
ncbi:hypothetical protein B5P43_31800 [Bacillus sp. SRB_336]|nr:hypothetical protein B5P43_31800 [Bacillus sp. SRB_336]